MTKLSTYEVIVRDITQGRKEKNIPLVTLLSTLKGELQRISDGKPETLSEDKVLKKVRGMLESTEEVIKHTGLTEQLNFEKELLECYLPQMMTGDETFDAVQSAIEKVQASSMKDMGKVMSALKKYSSVMDMKVASTLVKELLS